MERHPIELVRPLKPVITVVGLETGDQLERTLFSGLSAKFEFIFTPQYRETAALKRVPITGLKSALPAPLIGWIAKYSGRGEVPSVILDVQREARGLEEAMVAGQEALRATGIKYAAFLVVDEDSKGEAALVMRRLSFDQRSLVTIFDHTESTTDVMERLQKTLEQLSLLFYKEKAKKCRKRASQKTSSFPSAEQFWGPLVRYNFKAGWFEEMAGDLGGAVKSYHVAYSALVEQAKRGEGAGFVEQIRWIADILAVKVHRRV